MANAQTTTLSSREFRQNPSAATRLVSEGGTVIITNRGTATMALVPINEYRKRDGGQKSMVDLLRMPEADGFDLDFEPIRIGAKDIEA